MVDTKRSLKNVSTTRAFVVRYAGIWLVVAVLAVAVSAIALYLLNEAQWDRLVALSPALAAQRAEATRSFLLIVGGQALLVLFGLGALAVMTTHRLAGPFVRMQKVCEAVRDGQAGVRMRFRAENPELDALEDAFNGMLDAIEARAAAAGRKLG